MVRLSTVDRARALGMVQGGTSQENVARHFNVHKSTISKLMTRYRDTGDVKDRIRSGRPRITSSQHRSAYCWSCCQASVCDCKCHPSRGS